MGDGLMGLRNRYVKADFWSDAKLFDLNDTAKLLYIGLWAEADDHGWLRWDPAQIAVDLRRGAEGVAEIEQVGATLGQRGRLLVLACGHAVIPTFMKHQTRIAAAARTRTYLTEHEKQCVNTSSTELDRAQPRSSSPGGEGRGGEVSSTRREPSSTELDRAPTRERYERWAQSKDVQIAKAAQEWLDQHPEETA